MNMLIVRLVCDLRTEEVELSTRVEELLFSLIVFFKSDIAFSRSAKNEQDW